MDHTPNKEPIENQSSINKQRSIQLTLLSNGQSIFCMKKVENNECKIDDRTFLMNRHRVYCKFIGISSSSKNMTDFVDSPCLLDAFATKYVIEEKLCEYTSRENKRMVNNIQNFEVKYKIYKYYLQNNFFLIDGHKFGGDFLLYEGNPDTVHASKLVFIEDNPDKQTEIIKSRLSGICKKKGIIAWISKEEGGVKEKEIEIVSKRKEKGFKSKGKQKIDVNEQIQ